MFFVQYIQKSQYA